MVLVLPLWAWLILVAIGAVLWVIDLVYLGPKRRRERAARKRKLY